MAFHDDLLEQAQHLANRDSRRPKQASLRRAVSTAYYALFHLLTSAATANWRRPHQRPDLARSFNHGHMRKACESQRTESRGKLKELDLDARSMRVFQCIEKVCAAFVALQDSRHTADYDTATGWSRTEANAAVKSAVAAFEAWKAVREEPEAQDFLLALLVKRR